MRLTQIDAIPGLYTDAASAFTRSFITSNLSAISSNSMASLSSISAHSSGTVISSDTEVVCIFAIIRFFVLHINKPTRI